MTRPSAFSWTYPKNAGQRALITASEWNGLTDNINAVRVYKGFSRITFDQAVIGRPLTATQYNTVAQCINGMIGVTAITEVNANTPAFPISADALNRIVSAINSIT